MYGDWARTVVLVSAGCIVTLMGQSLCELCFVPWCICLSFVRLKRSIYKQSCRNCRHLQANIFMNTSHRMYFGLTTWINAWIGSWIVAWWNSRAIAAEWQRQPTFTFTHCTLHNWCQKGMKSLQIILSFVLLLYILAQASVLLSHQIIQPNKQLSRSRPMLKQCHRGSLHNTTLVLGPTLSHWDIGYAEWQQTRRGASSGHKSVFTLDLRKCSLVNWGAICAKVCPSQFWLVSS